MLGDREGSTVVGFLLHQLGDDVGEVRSPARRLLRQTVELPVRRIAHDEALFAVEHREADRQIAQRCFEQRVLLLQGSLVVQVRALNDGGGEGRQQNDERYRGDDQGEVRPVHADPFEGNCRIEVDGDRTHGGEMQNADRGGEQGTGAHDRLRPRSAVECEHGGRRDGATENPRGHDEVAVPLDGAGNDESRHAGEVHRPYGEADEYAAQGHPPTIAAGRHGKPHGGQDDGDEQRADGGDGLVVRRQRTLVGKHGDEMCRPDTRAGADAGKCRPEEFAGTAARISDGVHEE